MTGPYHKPLPSAAPRPLAAKAKLLEFEGLRGWLAWWVVVGHSLDESGWSASFLPTIGKFFMGQMFAVRIFIILSGFVITVPPLRDRREDIPRLVQVFLARSAKRTKKDVRAVSPDAMSALMDYRWPGNVRELEHAIERAVIVTRHPSIRLRDLPPEVANRTAPSPPDDSLDLQVHEEALIRRALERYHGNRRQAARALNISSVTLWRRMKELGISA